MRPRREVLLLTRNEDELGMWRMRMEIWGYRVHACLTLDEAMDHLSRWPVDAIATMVHGARGADALAASFGKVLLFGTDARLAPGQAHRYVPDGPALAGNVREVLKEMCARKRGPKPAAKKPVASAAIEAKERAA